MLRVVKDIAKEVLVLAKLRQRTYPRMSLFVISACSLACPECIMQYLMKSRLQYQMTIEEIQNLLAACEESNYKFDFVLTGGEPLLWRHLNEGIRMLRQKTSVTNSITIFSNVTHIHQVDDELIHNIDQLRISAYPTNQENRELLLKKYPTKVSIVPREEFWPNPDGPLTNVLPARCANSEVMYFDNNVYACPHSLSIAIHAGIKDLKLAEPLRKNFLSTKEKIRHDQEKDICTRCISNLRVREQVEKVHNGAPFNGKGAGVKQQEMGIQ